MRKSTAVGVLVTAIVFACWASAGTLEPPGPPSATQRTPIFTVDLPLTIASPGSYFLAEGITAAGGGIIVDADNVEIDLMGFSLSGGMGDGIFATPGRVNVTVRNGTVSGWAEDGVDLAGSERSRILNIRSEGNGGAGLLLGIKGSIRESISVGNGGVGIVTGFTSSLIDSIAVDNIGGGFSVGNSSTILGCHVSGNGQASVGDGITGGTGVNISHTTVYENQGDGIHLDGPIEIGGAIANCVVRGNNGDGIDVRTGAILITQTNASLNQGNGIVVEGGSVLTGNACHRNGSPNGDGAGIHATGSGNRIEANHVTNNDRGIDVDAGGNVIIKNSASGNTTNYDIVGGNDVGPLGTAATATSPWANLEP